MIKFLIQLINHLTTEYDDVVRHTGELQNSAQHAMEVEQQMQEMRQLLDRATKKIAVLEEKVQATQYEKNEAMSKLMDSNMEYYKLQNILHAAVKSVKEALEVKHLLIIFNNLEVIESTDLYVLNFCLGMLSCMYVLHLVL
jgi:chromosome segregation ATPase